MNSLDIGLDDPEDHPDILELLELVDRLTTTDAALLPESRDPDLLETRTDF